MSRARAVCVVVVALLSVQDSAHATPIPTQAFATVYNPTVSTVCPTGTQCLYADSATGKVFVHGSNNLLTEISPGISQPFPAASALGTNATWLFQSGLDGANPGDFYQLNPNDGHNQPFRFFASAASNLPGDTQQDVLYQFIGYNAGTAGNFSATDGSWQNVFESHCANALGCGFNQMERYEIFAPPTSSGIAGTRWLTCNQKVQAPWDLQCGLVADTVGLGVSPNNPGGGTITQADQILLTFKSTQINAFDPNLGSTPHINLDQNNGVDIEGGPQVVNVGTGMPTTAGHFTQYGAAWPQEQYNNTIASRPAGANVTSASQITPTGVSFILTGTTTVDTILDENNACAFGGYTCDHTITCRDACVFSAAGNIAFAFTGTPNTTYHFTKQTSGKWYPTFSPFEWTFSTYTATHASSTGLHQQVTLSYNGTIQSGTFVVDTTGSGGGNMTVKVCDDGATCGVGHVYVTCTTACNATPGTVTTCTVNTTSVTSGTTLSWTETAGCGTNDLGGNMSAHIVGQ